jgi:hypothetical protein
LPSSYADVLGTNCKKGYSLISSKIGAATTESDEQGLFDRIRSACAEVARRASSVRIDESELSRFAARLAIEPWSDEGLDPARDLEGSEVEKLAFVVALDAINFGSGWFPFLRKRKGMSGYRTIAAACRERFESEGAWSGEALRAITPESMANLLGQERRDPDVYELMQLYAQAWCDLGKWLEQEYDDCFETFVAAAGGSAERMVLSLAKMPLYRDVSSYRGISVPFYKRAQITAADLHHALGSSPLGQFDDLDQLTLFADNLVPHVLRCEGVLRYERELTDKIDREEMLEAGSACEVEIRAVAVEAVERIIRELRGHGRRMTAHELDGMLWNGGQAPRIKGRPRHRTRTSYY